VQHRNLDPSHPNLDRLFKPLLPLWGRQIPYTMMKFAAFENIVSALYTNVVPKPKAECSKTEQLGVSFAAGYIAGARLGRGREERSARGSRTSIDPVSDAAQRNASGVSRLTRKHGEAVHSCGQRLLSRLSCATSHSNPSPSGILCAVVSQPADNLVSKLSANPNATVGGIVSEMGIVNLATRGLPLRILMVGTLTGLQWGIYDAYKVRVWCQGLVLWVEGLWFQV